MWLTEKVNDAMDWATETKTRGAVIGTVAMVGLTVATGGLALPVVVAMAAGGAAVGSAISGKEDKK